jgi:formylglycine-generating enzyme required for sulfatase activity
MKLSVTRPTPRGWWGWGVGVVVAAAGLAWAIGAVADTENAASTPAVCAQVATKEAELNEAWDIAQTRCKWSKPAGRVLCVYRHGQAQATADGFAIRRSGERHVSVNVGDPVCVGDTVLTWSDSGVAIQLLSRKDGAPARDQGTLSLGPHAVFDATPEVLWVKAGRVQYANRAPGHKEIDIKLHFGVAALGRLGSAFSADVKSECGDPVAVAVDGEVGSGHFAEFLAGQTTTRVEAGQVAVLGPKIRSRPKPVVEASPKVKAWVKESGEQLERLAALDPRPDPSSPPEPAPEPVPSQAGALPTRPATDHRPAMVAVPAGRYAVGSKADEPFREDNEELQHEVDLSEGQRFEVGATEVTQAQWTAVMGGNPSSFRGSRGGPDHPVENMNWFEAVEYLNALTEHENATRESAQRMFPCYRLTGCRGQMGKDYACDAVERVPRCTGYRLPSEREWEIAARAGTTGMTYAGDFASESGTVPELEDIAWYPGNSRSGTRAVGLKRPNAWGLFDTLGNVWEWTESVDLHWRAVRGCGWSNSARFCRASLRYPYPPDWRDDNLGLRPARSLSP